MFDWLFGRDKKDLKIRVFHDKNGKPRVQVLDDRPLTERIRRVLMITSASSFRNDGEAREVAQMLSRGGTISDEIAVNWHD